MSCVTAASASEEAHQALREVYKWLSFRCHWVIGADLTSFFDTTPHDKLLLTIPTRVIDLVGCATDCHVAQGRCHVEQVRQVLDRLVLRSTLRRHGTEPDPFDFLRHRFTVRPSERTGERTRYYFPSVEANP